jgi:hypothetical protein
MNKLSSHTNETETSNTVRRTFDWSATQPTTAVVDTVAKDAGSDPTELPALYDELDPGALNKIVESGEPDISVSFVYNDRNITVHGQGDVVVRSQDPTS